MPHHLPARDTDTRQDVGVPLRHGLCAMSRAKGSAVVDISGTDMPVKSAEELMLTIGQNNEDPSSPCVLTTRLQSSDPVLSQSVTHTTLECPIPPRIQYASAARLREYVYVFGGRVRSTNLDSMYGHCCFTLGKRVYMAGGYNVDYLSKCWCYDPGLRGYWIRFGDAPKGFCHATSVVVGDKAHIMGGFGTETMHVTFSARDGWQTEGLLPFCVYGAVAETRGVEVCVYGGTCHEGQVHVYDTERREWRETHNPTHS
ncbi:hypothetical protein KIPB_005492 [Kipferlia bialata]|uniref:Uncharacterized protein n=1 Tax=Kipferlia bialata TaxID=797122 RepID=A0A9K3CW36_9EUKA|nr:hypothetical protein KIPB_005492 [Kipferlia bialata]|eukprot:g5492.t1